MKTGFLVCAVVYSVFMATIAATAHPLVKLMAQSEDLTDDTVAYIRLELVAIVASSLAKFLTSVMVVHEMNALLYLTLAAQMVASITLDYLLGRWVFDINVTHTHRQTYRQTDIVTYPRILISSHNGCPMLIILRV